jgi:hypothetical protein
LAFCVGAELTSKLKRGLPHHDGWAKRVDGTLLTLTRYQNLRILESLAEHLQYNCVTKDKTLFKGISLLPSGFCWDFEDSVLPKRRYSGQPCYIETWIGSTPLKFDYDMSIPNVAHLDPQRGGSCTIFPFFIGNIIELPVTTTQDYSLLHILSDYSTGLWQKQVALIREKHGLISFIIHPDYIIPKRARRVYSELLLDLSQLHSRGETWIALPT